jgi:hypothetical protein
MHVIETVLREPSGVDPASDAVGACTIAKITFKSFNAEGDVSKLQAEDFIFAVKTSDDRPAFANSITS